MKTKKKPGAKPKAGAGKSPARRASDVGKIVTDPVVLDAKYGRAAAECFARMNAEALQREREAHLADVQEALHDVTALGTELEHKRSMVDELKRANKTDARLSAMQSDLDNIFAKLDNGRNIAEETRALAGAAATRNVNRLTTLQKNAVKRFNADRDRQERKAKRNKDKNHIMTEVRKTMKKNPQLSQSAACFNVAMKHLKADGKTPVYSKRTIENWMSARAKPRDSRGK